MKKIVLLIAMIALVLHYTQAQSIDDEMDRRDKFLIGLKTGFNYSNVYDSQGEEFNADGKLGFVVGGFFAIPIGKYLGVQPEILLSQKGFKAKGRLLGSAYKFTRTTTYLDIPIMLSVKASEFVSIMAGPQYSYLLKQKDVFTTTAASYDQATEFKNDDVRKNMLCFLAGVDITVKNIVVGARLGWDLQNNNGNGSSTTPRYKNVWYQTTLGYRF